MAILAAWLLAKAEPAFAVERLVTVLVISGLQVVPPILMRELVDDAIPRGDVGRLTLLGIGMIAVPSSYSSNMPRKI